VSTPDPVAELLGAVAACFGERRLRWLLFGAQAVVVWGRPRLTADVDVTVEVGEGDVAGLVAALEMAGFDLRIRSGVDEFVARTRVLPFAHRASGILLDVVLAGPGLEERFLEKARPVEIGPHTIPVIAPEHLVVAKILAGRPKDIDDVRGVLATRQGELDLGEIRALLGLLEEALGQSDLLPLFEEELARTRPR
jgi:hypothetical protein